MYCKEFERVYKVAGTTSFQLSPDKTVADNDANREVAGREGCTDLECSYKATVKHIASFRISFKKTAVEVIYRRPSGTGITLE